MDRIFVRFLLLEEHQIVGVVVALFLLGALLAALLTRVTWRLRRVSYLLLVVLLGLIASIMNLGLILLPYVADAGYLSLVGSTTMIVYVLTGAGHYLLAAARSNHICGHRRKTWMAFVPIANLVLAFSRGEYHWDEESGRSRLQFLGDGLLVILALALWGGGKYFDGVVEGWEVSDDMYSPTLSRLISEVQTVEDSFAYEAEVTNPDLPMRIDAETVLTRVEAEGRTLRFILLVESEDTTHWGGVREALVDFACAPDKFSHDIGRGGQVIYRYQRLNGEVLAEFPITTTDCFL